MRLSSSPYLIQFDLFDLLTEVLLLTHGAEDTHLKRIAVALTCDRFVHHGFTLALGSDIFFDCITLLGRARAVALGALVTMLATTTVDGLSVTLHACHIPIKA